MTTTTEKLTYDRLLAELAGELARHSPRSREVHERASRVLVDGGSHTIRLLHPFPPRIVEARGGWIRDRDGHDLLDFWQGHLANVLGHNPEVVTAPLARAFGGRFGLQSGVADLLQVEVAEMLCERTQAERVRLTTSGALANMYAILLSAAHTGRELVLKAGGGWHGAQPWSLKGVAFRAEGGVGFGGVESEGLPSDLSERTIITRYNDAQRLADHFREHGDRLACFVVEPMIGAGGLVPATSEYLQLARELTEHHGAVLVLDEVITGFRFRAGDVGSLYGIRPDLAIFGKVIGGGMPVSAVGGRAEILELAGRAKGHRVSFTGGTYCGHPASMLAARTMMTHLVEHEAEVYPRLADLGERARRSVERAFAAEGIEARCTGSRGVLTESSMFFIHFPRDDGVDLESPEMLADPARCDVELSRKVLEVALLAEGVHLIRGHGAASAAHAEADMERLEQACRQVARRVNRHR